MRVALVAALLAVASLSAAPGFWQAATQADFLRGELDQLSVDEHGRVTLGPQLTRCRSCGRRWLQPTAACSSAPATTARS
jgi:hypothetical protein